MAPWSGRLPDLFVVDWGAPRAPPTIRIFSAESGFRKTVFVHALPQTLSAGAGFEVLAARLSGGLSDLILVRRSTENGGPEVHILTGESSFTRFDNHLAIPSAPIPESATITAGTRLGAAVLYLVQPAGPRPTVSLLALPYTSNVPH